MAKKFSKRGHTMLDRIVDNGDFGRLLLRLALGFLMLFHGVNKLQYGYGFVGAMLGKAGLPVALSHGILVGEFVAPLFILLGLYTRPAALVQAFVMVMALYLVHTKDLWSLNEHGGYALELQMLYLFGSLALFFLGAGRFSLSKGQDAWR